MLSGRLLLNSKNYAERLETRVKELERSTMTLESLTHSGNVYTKEGDPTPFCGPCPQVKRLPVHLQKTTVVAGGKRVWECPNCHTKVVNFGDHPIE